MQLKGDQSMKPREILEYYQRLGWDAPKVGSAKLDEGISGGLSYLLNRKGILKKQKGIFDQADAPRRNKPRSTYSSASLKRSLQSITGCFLRHRRSLPRMSLSRSRFILPETPNHTRTKPQGPERNFRADGP